jgi:uncharacterized protein YjiS (DUF1127 family)
MNMHIFSNWIRHRRERAELEAMDTTEFGRLAHDIGVSSSELERMVEAGHDPKRLSEMLCALGLDEAALARAEPAMLRDMQRLCSLCETIGTCRHALDAGIAPTTYRSFCVNAATLEALKAEKARAEKAKAEQSKA